MSLKLEEEVTMVEEMLEEGRLEDAKKFLNQNPTIAAHIIDHLPFPLIGPAFRLLSKNNAIEVFEELEPEDQTQVIESLGAEEGAKMFSHLPPDDQIQLLDEVPAKVAKKLLASLGKNQLDTAMTLLGYPRGSAGRLMTPNYLSLKKEMTVREALERIRKAGLTSETIYYCYVTDRERHLEGVVSLRNLVVAEPDQIVQDLMDPEVIAVSTHDKQELVARLLGDLDFLAIPVVDKENRLVGIITIDDAIDVLEREETMTAYSSVGVTPVEQEGLRSLRLIEGPMSQSLRVRLPFLLITLVGGMVAGRLIGAFEQTLETVVALAFFIPVIMDMGGNVGTQSSTIFARAIALGQIKLDSFWTYLLREAFVGLALGLLIGIGGGLFAWFWQGDPNIGIVVGLSLIFTMVLASILGFLIPRLVLAMGFDQAAGSVPIITSIKDMSGILIYFLLANFFLGIV